MRVARWNPNRMDQEFDKVAIERLVEAANVVATSARQRCPVKTGELQRSIRVARKKTKSGKSFSKKLNVRVYAGSSKTNKAYYAKWIEHGTSKAPAHPFMRPALYGSMPEIKSIIGVK